MKLEKYFTSILGNRAKESYIRILNLELTNKCQLNCFWCADRKTRPVGEMPLSTIKYMMGKLNGPLEIRFFCSGEPTLYKKLPEAMEMVLVKGHSVNIHSNGVSLTKEMAGRILEAAKKYPKKIFFSFSIDGRNEKEYRKIRGPFLDTVLNNVDYFINENNALNAPINITIQTIVPFLCRMRSPQFIPEYPNVEYYTRWPHDFDCEGKIPCATVGEIYKPPCGFLIDSLVIYWNGDIPICCADLNGDRVIGNIFEEGLSYCMMIRDWAAEMQKRGLDCPICEGCGRYKPDNKPACGR